LGDFFQKKLDGGAHDVTI